MCARMIIQADINNVYLRVDNTLSGYIVIQVSQVNDIKLNKKRRWMM